MTNAGAMRDVVRIEQRTTAQDGAGEEVPSWSVVITARAERVPYPGFETWVANQRAARVPTMFKMRWPKTVEVKPQMRLICKEKLYDIISAINVDGRDVDMLVSCDELINEPTS